MSALLKQIVNESVERSENRESWTNIIASARPYLNLESHDLTDNNSMSSENFEDLETFNNIGDKKQCRVPYAFKYDFLQDEETTTSEARTSQDEEVSGDENKKICNKSSNLVRKRKAGGAFSRNAYSKRRRNRLKQTSKQIQQTTQLTTKPNKTSALACLRQDSSASQDSPEEAPKSSNDDEINKLDGGGIVDLGKGKRKRFQNVRMLPIEEVCRSPPRNKK